MTRTNSHIYTLLKHTSNYTFIAIRAFIHEQGYLLVRSMKKVGLFVYNLFEDSHCHISLVDIALLLLH